MKPLQMMKQLYFLMFCIFTFSVFGQSNLIFHVDPNYRLDSATTRKVVLVHDTMFLYYGAELDTNGTPLGLAISTDQPDYLNFTRVNLTDYPLYYFHHLPDGRYRQYTYDVNSGGVISRTSTDGYTSTQDTGLRYVLQPDDNGTFGVSTYFNDTLGQVHMLYIGDMGGGVDNTRHAVSTDGGDSFSFVSNNVLGDYSSPNGNQNYWDPYSLVMSDKTIRVFTMNQHGISAPPFNPTGNIYTFLSTDNGQTFHIEYDLYGDSVRFKYDDFTGMTNTSLNDPKAVELLDGRIKVFVNGLVLQSDSSYRWQILSATSGCDSIPVAAFTYTNNGSDYQFYSNSSNADSYFWDFGDGTSDTVLTPLHHYNLSSNYTVCFVASNYCGSDTICNVININTGIGQDNLGNIMQIFPNPVVNELMVQLKTNTHLKGKIYIRNTLGQILLEKTIAKPLYSIDISTLSMGCYIIEVRTSEYDLFRKFFKE